MTEQVRPHLKSTQSVDLTIYNMVDTEKFTPDDSIERDILSVASVASLTSKKGVFQLLEAWRIVHGQMPDAKLIYYGRDLVEDKGSNQELLQRLANDYGISDSIVFKGSWPYDDLVNVFRKHAVIIFPSYMEAHPRAWLEAMSTGAPVIGSNRGPGEEVIRHNDTGLIIDPDNVPQMAEAIVQLLQNRKLALRLGTAARDDMVARFSIPSILQQNTDFYSSCLFPKV